MPTPKAGFHQSGFLRFSLRQRKSRKIPVFRPRRKSCCDRNRGLRVPFEIWDAHIHGRTIMHVNIILLQPLVALLFGILILILPRLLNYLIAIYLILIGLTGLFPHLFTSTLNV
jgi:hypothetical protein